MTLAPLLLEMVILMFLCVIHRFDFDGLVLKLVKLKKKEFDTRINVTFCVALT